MKCNEKIRVPSPGHGVGLMVNRFRKNPFGDKAKYAEPSMNDSWTCRESGMEAQKGFEILGLGDPFTLAHDGLGAVMFVQSVDVHVR
ncbi:MAG: hypothetical protein BWY82_01288 [Verrucomicrobia bacterium ADurb.Bin474]|nr:MAG: hypothetical protein BWY82_01288 [Verrucomicrobia bacterium ADurb.Bin474]